MNLIDQSLGRYHILEQLGEGGMATVYKAYDTRLETDVAVKVIRTEEFSPKVLERSLKRFEREAKSLARLTHPNIVKVTDYGEHEGKPYLVMPYLPGGTLKDRIKQGPIPWQEAVRLLLPIAQALEYAHEQSLIHRDVKPSNILLTAKGQPMLTDFGVAKLFDMDVTADLTGTGMGVGTPEYMAPEQWQGQVDAQTDVYALGVLLYEMITGRRPYTADTPAALLIKQTNDPLPRPSQFVRDLPDYAEKLLIKTLAKNPHDRFASMGACASALETLLNGQVVAPKPKSAPKREQTRTVTEAAADQKITHEAPLISLVGTKKQSLSSHRICPIVLVLFILALTLVSVIASFIKPARSTRTSTPIVTGSPAVAEIPTQTAIPESTTDNIGMTPFVSISTDGLLLSEDFEDGRAQGLDITHTYISGVWKVVSDKTGNKVYEIDNTSSTADFAGIDFGTTTSQDYIIEYRTKALNKNAWVALNFRRNSKFANNIDFKWGDSVIMLWIDGAQPGEYITRDYEFVPERWYTIRVEALGSEIMLFIDNSLAMDSTDPLPRAGGFGFFISPGTHAQFDDISVTVLDK